MQAMHDAQDTADHIEHLVDNDRVRCALSTGSLSARTFESVLWHVKLKHLIFVRVKRLLLAER